MSLLTAVLNGITFPNPFLLASGVVGNSLDKLRLAIKYGAGGVISKSVGLLPRKGYPTPNVLKLDYGLLNAIGLSNPGVKAIIPMLSDNKVGPRMIISIFGSEPDEYCELIRRLDKYKFPGYELNLSCPHVKGTGTDIGHDPALVFDVVNKSRKRSRKLIIAKLSPNTDKIVEVGKEAERAGADALTLINTVRAMDIDIVSQKPSLSNIYGGLSGPSIKPIALRCVYELFEEVKIPLIGCGGISKWEDAIQFLLAGARFIEVGTAFIEDYSVFRNIAKGVENYVKQRHLESYTELIGLAH